MTSSPSSLPLRGTPSQGLWGATLGFFVFVFLALLSLAMVWLLKYVREAAAAESV